MHRHFCPFLLPLYLPISLSCLMLTLRRYQGTLIAVSIPVSGELRCSVHRAVGRTVQEEDSLAQKTSNSKGLQVFPIPRHSHLLSEIPKDHAQGASSWKSERNSSIHMCECSSSVPGWHSPINVSNQEMLIGTARSCRWECPRLHRSMFLEEDGEQVREG